MAIFGPIFGLILGPKILLNCHPESVGLYAGNGHFVVSNAALLLVLFAAVVITIVCWYIPAMLIVGAVIVVLALIWKV